MTTAKLLTKHIAITAVFAVIAGFFANNAYNAILWRDKGDLILAVFIVAGIGLVFLVTEFFWITKDIEKMWEVDMSEEK